MPRNEEGEYELLLGNRQLLSIFVIVVVLLGIFFAMGYVTGKNSGGSTGASVAAAGSPAPSGPDQSSNKPPASGPVATPAPPPAEPPAEAPVEKPVPAETPRASVSEPEPGQTFLQITAVERHDADIMSETLNKRGFHALVAPSPKGLFRVLVGPTHDAAELARLRTQLEEAGFRNPIVRKY